MAESHGYARERHRLVLDQAVHVPGGQLQLGHKRGDRQQRVGRHPAGAHDDQCRRDRGAHLRRSGAGARLRAEELGITSENVEDEAASNENPVVQRLLGVTPADADPFGQVPSGE